MLVRVRQSNWAWVVPESARKSVGAAIDRPVGLGSPAEWAKWPRLEPVIAGIARDSQAGMNGAVRPGSPHVCNWTALPFTPVSPLVTSLCKGFSPSLMRLPFWGIMPFPKLTLLSWLHLTYIFNLSRVSAMFRECQGWFVKVCGWFVHLSWFFSCCCCLYCFYCFGRLLQLKRHFLSLLSLPLLTLLHCLVLCSKGFKKLKGISYV